MSKFRNALGRIIARSPLILCTVSAIASSATEHLPVPTAYAQYCTACHGAALQGGVAPSLRNAEWQSAAALESLKVIIRNGRPGQGMPAWDGRLSDSQISEIAQYIQSENSKIPVADKPTSEVAGVVKGQIYDLRVEQLVDLERLEMTPLSMTFLPNGDLLLAGKTTLNVLRHESKQVHRVEGLSVSSVSSVAMHPDYSRNGWVYLLAKSNDKGSPGQLIRGRIKDGRWTDTQVLALDEANDGVGLRIVFDGQGYVFITEGTSEWPQEDEVEVTRRDAVCQDLSKVGGKILRLHDDGRIPTDNPFASRPGARKAIWSYGHRRPQGLTFDPVTAALWSTEHGPWGGDELNRIVGGHNYGYPVVSLGHHYTALLPFERHREGMDDPVFHWTPSIGISNLVVYRGAAFPKWQGHLLVASLGSPRVGRTLYRFNLVDGQAVLFSIPRDTTGRALKDKRGMSIPPTRQYEEVLPGIGRIRDIAVSPEGFVYLLMHRPARLLRVTPISEATTVRPLLDRDLP